MCEEKLLIREAEAAVEELAFAVKEISISKKLPNSDTCVYINFTTCEGQDYCAEVRRRGWCITAEQYDTLPVDPASEYDKSKWFETMYQLLDSISPEYRNRFSRKIASELEKHLESTAAGTSEEKA